MSEQHIQICRFCQRNIKLAYYCEDCGISCCSDCLNEEKVESFICQDCNSKNIDNFDSGKKKICKDCGNDHINQITQLLKSCPKCHSHKIINVYEKKEELEKGFLDLIKNVRTFIDPLREVSNALYDLKQKVMDARAPPIKCYHYSNMEADLLSLFKLLNYAKETLLAKLRNLIQHLSMNKDYFFNIYSQPNSNIRIIEDILGSITRTYNSINEFIENNINTINKSIEPFSKNLNFIQKITGYFKKYIRFLNLAEQEKPIYAIYAKLMNGLNTQDKYKKNKGILFITNFDLSFVHEYGRVKRKRETIFKAPVSDLTRVKITGRMFKKLFIEFPYGRYEFTLPTNALSKVMDYILLARTFDETIIYDENIANKLFDVEIDLNYLTNFIEEAINSFFSLKCTYNNINQKQQFSATPYNTNNGIHASFDKTTINPHYVPNPGYDQRSNFPFINSVPYYENVSPRHYPNQLLYQNNSLNYPLQNPAGFRYYRKPLGNNYFSLNNEDDFFLQNFYDTSRIQNYQPSYYSNPLNTPISAFDEKNILMRRLEQLNKARSPGVYPHNPISP
ncbi:MAG: B-box zinc finger protein, partial [Candidatus Hermodarchaeota archaeon]